jgi:phage terminase small subunit
MLCTALATYFDADAIVQETGIVITAGQSDDLVQNPAVGIRERNDAIVAKWAKVFGLAPEPPGKAAAAPADQPRGMRHTREH